MRPPEVLPFGWMVQLLLLRGLLGFLLLGSLFGCLFGCHLPILPFDDFASTLQHLVQLRNV